MSIRVLVVEDNPSIADFLTRGLREEGYFVTCAADGVEGSERLQTESWDVVLLDCWLPRADGLIVLKQFREQGGVTPVLMLTARDAIADRVRGLDSGADDYLCKPFSFDELLARIRSLCRRERRPASTLLSYADVRVDLSTQRSERNGKRLGLTAKEQSLLTYFMRNSGKVLTRESIYEHAWNASYDGLSNTLEVHVMDLRRKLEAHGPRLIFTLRGRGYTMSEKLQRQ